MHRPSYMGMKSDSSKGVPCQKVSKYDNSYVTRHSLCNHFFCRISRYRSSGGRGGAIAGGTIAGIVIGSIVGAIVIGIIIYVIYRKCIRS